MMSAHGLVRVHPDVFEGVVYRQRLYPVFVRDVENWIDVAGHVVAKRVSSKPAIFLVLAHSMEPAPDSRKWEED